MITQNIKQYLKNKEARDQMSYTYLGWMGTGFYSDKDNVLSDEEFKNMYPLGVKITMWDYYEKGENPDKTRII